MFPIVISTFLTDDFKYLLDIIKKKKTYFISYGFGNDLKILSFQKKREIYRIIF